MKFICLALSGCICNVMDGLLFSWYRARFPAAVHSFVSGHLHCARGYIGYVTHTVGRFVGQLYQPSLKPLFVAVRSRLQLQVVRWAASVEVRKVFDN